MITVHRLNGSAFTLNGEMIETVEEKPDTTIRMSNGNLYIVQEAMEDVVRAVRAYKRDLFTNLLRGDDL